MLRALGETPRYEEFPDPIVEDESEVLLQVKASPLTNLTKAIASGQHYASYKQLPAVVGVDGVGLLENGTRVYCYDSRPPYGMMAERTVVSLSRCVPIPSRISDIDAACRKRSSLNVPPMSWASTPACRN